MARFIYIAGVDEAAAVRFPAGFTGASAAEQGTVSIGTIEIDDPTGTFDLKNLNPAYIVETAASPTRLWTGYLYNLTIDRGPYRTGPGRVWRADCVDVNNLLTRRVVLSSNGARPAETDLARLTWLLANPVMSGLVVSGAFTNLTSGPINVDATDYRWQNPMEILADIAPRSGKVAFAFYNPSSGNVELFYDLVDASTYDSTAKISNVAADVGTGVYAPYHDASMDRVGENLASKAVLRWLGGATVQENLTTKSTYGEMTYTWDSSRIGKAATAATQVALILAAKSSPDETVTCTVLLTAAHVNDILEAQRIQVKFSHLPGLTSYTWMRVISRAIAVDDGDDYLVKLVLSNKVRPPLGGGPGTGDFPHQPADVAVVQTISGQNLTPTPGTVTLSQAPSAGNVFAVWETNRGSTLGTTPTGWSVAVANTQYGADYGRFLYRTVTSSDTTSVNILHSSNPGCDYVFWEISGVGLTPDTSANNFVTTGTMPGSYNSGTVTPTAGVKAVLLLGQGVHCSDFIGQATFITAGSGFTQDAQLWDDSHPLVYGAHQVVTSTSGSYATTQTMSGFSSNFGGYGGAVVAFTGQAVGDPPMPGQWVYDETPTPAPGGGRVTFSTAFPFADGSLRVFIDHVEETAAISSYDGAAGTFTLAFDPRSWEAILVSYQGR